MIDPKVLAEARHITENFPYTSRPCRIARALIEAAALSVPPMPSSCHPLEFPAAADPMGIVLYFDTDEHAVEFVAWLLKTSDTERRREQAP